MSTTNNTVNTNTSAGSTTASDATAAQGQVAPVRTAQPTDTYLPTYLLDIVPELELYQQLLDAEKKLDMYLVRKKIDLRQNIAQWSHQHRSRDSLNHHDSTKVRYLRIFVSNIAENQPWQDPSRDFGNASWTLRIEGRLLDDVKADDPSRPKFSSFIQDIAVDFKLKDEGNKIAKSLKTDGLSLLDPIQSNGEAPSADGNSSGITGEPLQQQEKREQPLQNFTNRQPTSDDKIVTAVEWHYDPSNPVDFDGLDIKRFGTENVECTITIQLRGFTGSCLEYSPELSLVLGTSHGSLHDAVYALYKYILINDLLVGNEPDLRMASHGGKDGNNNNNSNSSSNNGNNPQTAHSGNFAGSLSTSTSNGNEKTLIKLDSALLTLLPTTMTAGGKEPPKTLKLADLPALVGKHVSLQRPIKLDYTIRVDRASTYGEVVFDVEIPSDAYSATAPSANSSSGGSGGDNHNGENPTSTSDDVTEEGLKLVSELDKLSNEMKTKIDALNREAANLKLQLNLTANKYHFFDRLAKDPVPVLQEYIAASSNALKVLSGDEGFNEDTVRRAQFYIDNEDMLYENLGILLTNGRI